ncbi:MAG: hypothetical protein J6S75_05940 [Thermoguttaceae bacterium]|nr:hypothetical protein [Thermoguttaceae bacterium]
MSALPNVASALLSGGSSLNHSPCRGYYSGAVATGKVVFSPARAQIPLLAAALLVLGTAGAQEILVHNAPIPILNENYSYNVPQRPTLPPLPKFTDEVPTMGQIQTALNRQMQLRQSDKTLVETVTPFVIIQTSFAYGAGTQFLCRVSGSEPATGRPKTEPAYAIGILCWSIPARDKILLTDSVGGLYAKVGYGYQRVGGEFLAMLASAGVTDDYEIHPGGHGKTRRTVADLVESEKRQAVLYGPQAWRLAALAFYLSDVHQTWIASDGNEVSLLKLARYELDRPVLWDRGEAVDRLYGLALARERFAAETARGDGDPELAAMIENIDAFFHLLRPWIHSLRDPDSGLWMGRYLSEAPDESPRPIQVLLSSASILRWLILSAESDEEITELESDRTRKTIWNLALLLVNTLPPQTEYSALSDDQAAAWGTTLQVFRLYLEKFGRYEGETTADNRSF